MLSKSFLGMIDFSFLLSVYRHSFLPLFLSVPSLVEATTNQRFPLSLVFGTDRANERGAGSDKAQVYTVPSVVKRGHYR